MSYRTPAHRVAAVRQVRNALSASRRAVLTTHLNADGDGAGSEAALVSWLRANGTEAWIVNPTGYPAAFKFLLENEHYIRTESHEYWDALKLKVDSSPIRTEFEYVEALRVQP